MKRIFPFLLSAVSVACVYAQDAQEVATDCMSIDAVFDACVSMQKSLETNDTTALAEAAKALKDNKVTAFTSLRCKDDTIQSLNGHFVFNDVFVDSLAAGGNPYENADNINRSTTHRGQTTNGTILTKTCFVKAGKSTKHSFTSRGVQELGIITEPGGKVYVKVHATNASGFDEWYNDNKSAKDGTHRYKTRFNLPMDKRNTVEIEVINKGGKDTSFVVISN